MMRAMRLSELPVMLGGELHGDASFKHVDTDSRSAMAGGLFVALQGENFNGNDYVSEAAKRGVNAAIVSETSSAVLSYLCVKDTRHALGCLGAFNRQLFDKPVVAITGSTGKTTCKDMLASILNERYKIYATPHNYNNEIGVPLSLLALEPSHHAAVLELGARARGEIATLAEWVRPDVALMTNAQSAHIKGFGSMHGIMEAKGELLSYLSDNGTAILPGTLKEYDYWRSLCGKNVKVISFGLDKRADIYISSKASTLELCFGLDTTALSLNVLGEANKANAAAAAAAAVALGVDLPTIARGLESFNGSSKRLQLIHDAPVLIDDSYNANPDSVRVAIDVLAEYSGRRLLILGDMADLGATSAHHHKKIGAYALEKGIQSLWCCGNWTRYSAQAFGQGAQHYTHTDNLLHDAEQIIEMDAILVKGSRDMHMETVAQHIYEIIERQ